MEAEASLCPVPVPVPFMLLIPCLAHESRVGGQKSLRLPSNGQMGVEASQSKQKESTQRVRLPRCRTGPNRKSVLSKF
ncbi:hypothetical protein M434DRAFT_397426 [Hypoxylon sp. CO27-5]|nr:hypothetical protein M434DRAFT_397426 [Hypoxylon sp. CO27-5]